VSPEVPPVETERLLLRAWSETDVEPYARMLADLQVMHYMGFGLAATAKHLAAAAMPREARKQARRAIAFYTSHWAEHGLGHWAVEERASGLLIGRIGLFRHLDWTADSSNVEVGWLLARSAWDRGFATEGGTASLAFAFERLRVERVVSITRPGNVRSERVMQRLGLGLVGTTRWRGGKVIWYAIDRDTWAAQPGSAAS
jgi:RimJ/RimL family protein N-acetyltransferase